MAHYIESVGPRFNQNIPTINKYIKARSRPGAADSPDEIVIEIRTTGSVDGAEHSRPASTSTMRRSQFYRHWPTGTPENFM